MEKNYPLILVFYLDRETMRIEKIVQPFVQSVNDMLHAKNANAIAFFLPTDGEEFIDCINPTVVKEADMENVNKLIEDIRKNFSVGDKNDKTPDTDITPDKKD